MGGVSCPLSLGMWVDVVPIYVVSVNVISEEYP